MAPREISVCKVEMSQQVPVLLADGGAGRGVLGPVARGLASRACLCLSCVQSEAGHWLGAEGMVQEVGPAAVGGAGRGGCPGPVFRACQAPTGVCAHHLLSLSDVFLRQVCSLDGSQHCSVWSQSPARKSFDRFPGVGC